TMFRGIHKLSAGHCATFREGQLKIKQYWDLTFPRADAAYPHSEEELTDEIRERFRRSVQQQMISDVPVGAFLSAGLDSSSIVAMMAQASSQPIRDRKSTRLNSSHVSISYAVFCLKKKKTIKYNLKTYQIIKHQHVLIICIYCYSISS